MKLSLKSEKKIHSQTQKTDGVCCPCLHLTKHEKKSERKKENHAGQKRNVQKEKKNTKEG